MGGVAGETMDGGVARREEAAAVPPLAAAEGREGVEWRGLGIEEEVKEEEEKEEEDKVEERVDGRAGADVGGLWCREKAR